MLKEKLERVKYIVRSPEFQSQLEEIKPKKTLLGFIVICLVFFLPEVINILYYEEINNWLKDFVQIYTEPKFLVNFLLKSTAWVFDGKLSFINVGLGLAMLYWVFKPTKSA